MSGKKKGNKLKLKEVNSVDLCPQGANPDADICLFKSTDTTEPAVQTNPPASNDDNKRSFFKSIADAIATALQAAYPVPFPAEVVEKDSMSFNDITARQEIDENMWKYLRAFEESVNSIVRDGDIEAAEKSTMLNDTLAQFSAKMTSLFPALIGTTKADDDTPGELEKSITEGDDIMEINIKDLDTSKLSAEDQATFKALVEKCAEGEPATPPAAEGTPADPATSATEPAAKSAETPSLEDFPEFKKMFDEMAETKKAMESMIAKQAENEMLDVAKKYSILGKKPEELAGTLQTLKKSGDAAYNAYIEALDAQLNMVNKSGLFGEIGKSTHGDVGNSDEAFAKTETLAKSIAAEKGISMEQAMVQVWETHPELAEACAN